LKAEALFAELAQNHPSTAQYREAAASTQRRIAIAYDLRDRPDRAMDYYRRALSALESLTQENPNVIQFALIYGDTAKHMGVTINEHGSPAEAIETLNLAVRVLEGVCRRDASNRFGASYLYESIWERGLAYKKLGQYQPARRDYDRATELCTAVPKPSRLHEERADLKFLMGEYSGALMDIDAAEKAKPTGDELLTLAATCARAASNMKRDAKLADSERTALENQCQSRAVALLAVAKAAGQLAKAESLRKLETDATWEALRNRDDFRQLFSAK